MTDQERQEHGLERLATYCQRHSKQGAQVCHWYKEPYRRFYVTIDPDARHVLYNQASRYGVSLKQQIEPVSKDNYRGERVSWRLTAVAILQD